jgi:tetratricopeptide (TPR) repeat protein
LPQTPSIVQSHFLSALLGIGCIIGAGCAGGVRKSDNPSANHVSVLKYDDISSAVLFERANAKCRLNASVLELNSAVEYYQELEQRAPEVTVSVALYDIRWRMANAMFLLSEILPERDERLDWLARAEGVAESAIEECPDCVEGYYYAAVAKGRHAEISGNGFRALKLVKQVLSMGKKAVEIDDSFVFGAPLRLLAMLHAKAPPWPASVGDIDLAVELAERALSISDYPMNHLTMAEVLIEDDELQQAINELDHVLDAPLDDSKNAWNETWKQEGTVWRPYAAELKRQISLEVAD